MVVLRGAEASDEDNQALLYEFSEDSEGKMKPNFLEEKILCRKSSGKKGGIFRFWSDKDCADETKREIYLRMKLRVPRNKVALYNFVDLV
jgi:hypothetical protein